MRSSRLLKYFEEYIKKIDMNNTWSKAKYFHSLKSMDMARIIATDLGIFNEEEIVVIELIALFHDIGNFEQKNYNYLDNQQEDSTMKSIHILFDEGLLRKITTETKYDTLIKLGIFCHNKDALPKNIDENELAYYTIKEPGTYRVHCTQGKVKIGFGNIKKPIFEGKTDDGYSFVVTKETELELSCYYSNEFVL